MQNNLRANKELYEEVKVINNDLFGRKNKLYMYFFLLSGTRTKSRNDFSAAWPEESYLEIFEGKEKERFGGEKFLKFILIFISRQS